MATVDLGPIEEGAEHLLKPEMGIIGQHNYLAEVASNEKSKKEKPEYKESCLRAHLLSAIKSVICLKMGNPCFRPLQPTLKS